MLPRNIAVCGAEVWTIQTTDHTYLETSEVCCWRRMEISGIDLVK